MGLDYSINLYIPTHAIEVALQETVAMARPEPHSPCTEVMLPDSRIIMVPFVPGFGKPEPVILAPGSRSVLNTRLWLPCDADVRYYVLGGHVAEIGPERQSLEYLPIGSIYLHITVGPQISELAYTAATTKMSVMLANSRAVHGEFLSLLRAVGGISGVIYVEKTEYLLLRDFTRTVDMSDWETDSFDWSCRHRPAFIAELARRAGQLDVSLGADGTLPGE